MTRPAPYIGVSGFMNCDEVRAALSAHTSDRPLMVGVLASHKTIGLGALNKYPRRYPKREAIERIFVEYPSALNLVHYATDPDSEHLAAQLLNAMDAGGPYCNGVQVNVKWPDPRQLDIFREICPDARVVLQLGPSAMAEDFFCEDIRGTLRAYADCITDVLIDVSAGRGLAINALAACLAYTIRDCTDDIGVGIAGGLCAETLPEIAEFIRAGISIDAEGRLRDGADGGGNLDLDKVRACDCGRDCGRLTTGAACNCAAAYFDWRRIRCLRFRTTSVTAGPSTTCWPCTGSRPSDTAHTRTWYCSSTTRSPAHSPSRSFVSAAASS